MSKTLIGIVVGIAIGAAGYWAVSSGALYTVMPALKGALEGTASARPQTPGTKEAPVGQYCAKVITPARDPKTGTIKEFPTSCSVPPGWEPITNDVPGLDLQLQ